MRIAKLFFILCLCLISGCNIIAATAYKLAPDEVPAQYELPAKPTLILVENFRQPGGSTEDAMMVGQFIHSHLVKKQNEKSYTLIPVEKLLDFKSSRAADYQKLTVPDIARGVGAEQVIYVDLKTSGVSSMGDASLLKGKAASLVKVVDVSTGDVVWPKDITDGRSVAFETNPTDIAQKPRVSEIKYALYDGLGLQIARMFMKWNRD